MKNQIQRLRGSLFMFRETLNSLKLKKQIRDFEYPELINLVLMVILITENKLDK